MIGMILAAGLGTRLHPLTAHVPKPAVLVANRPLVAFAIDRLRAAGARELRANGHAHASLMERTLRTLEPGLRFFVEPELLGTGGGLANALRGVDEDVVVMNGDILFDVDLPRALAEHRASGAFATMIVRSDSNALAMGAVQVDSSSRVVAIAGAPDVGLEGCTPFAFTGVHVLSPRAIASIPATGCIVRQGYHRALAAGEHLHAVRDEARWADLGTLAAYLRTNMALARGEWRWAGVSPDARGVIANDVEHGDIAESVVGAGAIIDPGVRVIRSVVWPHSRIHEDAVDAIVTPNHRISP